MQIMISTTIIINNLTRALSFILKTYSLNY